MKAHLSFIKTARDKIQLLNQKLLPHKLDYVTCQNGTDVAKAIRDMVVRGAPAIGISAAYGMYLTAWEASKKNKKLTPDLLKKQKQTLDAARPTAVNLAWATGEMLSVANAFFATEASKAKDANLKLLLKLYEKALEIPEGKIQYSYPLQYGFACNGRYRYRTRRDQGTARKRQSQYGLCR
jgi:methylthioribose-1-phosphate isomerase